MKLLVSSFVLTVFFLFANVGISNAQISSITESEFLKVTNRESYWATAEKLPRKETWVYERYTDGRLTSSETTVSEYLAADKYKITQTVISNGKTTTSEEIQIGDIRYCKKDSSEWVADCPMPPPAAAMMPTEGAEYTLETGTDSKTYQRKYQSVWENRANATKTPVTTIDRIILNLDSSKRNRSIISTNTETKEILSRSTSKVEYGIKLYSIEAPIK